MTQSKSRQQAEIAFDRVQSSFFAHGQAVEERQTEEQARQAKTQRLREARLARDEARDQTRCVSFVSSYSDVVSSDAS